MSQSKKAIIYGGNGQLGKAVLSKFKTEGWFTIAVDRSANSDADVNVEVSGGSLKEDGPLVTEKLVEVANESDALICVAGGWRGGSIANDDVFENTQVLSSMCLDTSFIAAHAASKVLNKDGMLVLTGAGAAMGETSGMVGYGAVKAAVHHLIADLAADKDSFAEGVVVAGIAPGILDTKTNREGMPDADFSTWTPLETVADLLFDWSSGNNRPESGSIVDV